MNNDNRGDLIIDGGGGGGNRCSSRPRIRANPWLQKPLPCASITEHHHHRIISPNNTNAPPSPSKDKATNNNNTNTTTTNNNSIERHLSLLDLLSIGIGGTIGSGIFVLSGHIAHSYAGPASILSWILSGLAACLSGCAYAELACQIPEAGSSYVYVYVSMGELPAVVVAGCLTLEYLVSGAAIARSWGDKVLEWLRNSGYLLLVDNDNATMDDDGAVNWLGEILQPNFGNLNPLATIIATITVLLLLTGVKESKSITNFFTLTKVTLVSFMTILGLFLLRPSENLTPFLPAQFGVSGVIRGATSSFFGYIGFDEICCLAGEAKDPRKNIPKAIMATLASVTVLYVLATLALVGMQPYGDINEISGFPMAFQSRGWEWAARVSAFGEIFTLPIVVLLGLMAQPRLQYALAKDGLLPSLFARTDSSGNLWYGTLIAGVLMVFVASFVPFTDLNDVISAGILVAFCMTDSALLLLRHDPPPTTIHTKDSTSYDDNTVGSSKGNTLEWLVAMVNISAFAFGVTATHLWDTFPGSYLLAITSATLTLFATIQIYRTCPPVRCFGGTRRAHSSSIPYASETGVYFQTPCMPFTPCLGILANWFLIGQLELMAIGFLMVYLGGAVVFYFCYGFWHSVGNYGGWSSSVAGGGGEDCDCRNDEDNGSELTYMQRTISLPRVGSKVIGSHGSVETTYMT